MVYCDRKPTSRENDAGRKNRKAGIPTGGGRGGGARTTTLMQSDWYHLQSSASGPMPGGQNCPIMTRNLRRGARRVSKSVRERDEHCGKRRVAARRGTASRLASRRAETRRAGHPGPCDAARGSSGEAPGSSDARRRPLSPGRALLCFALLCSAPLFFTSTERGGGTWEPRRPGARSRRGPAPTLPARRAARGALARSGLGGLRW